MSGEAIQANVTGELLKRLCSDKRVTSFMTPVVGEDEYSSIISTPMDLGTIGANLDAYVSVDAFAADVRLVFSNAML